MGLIKAGMAAVKGVLADQWLEFVTADGIDSNKILVKREYPVKRGSNTKATEGVLTRGTRITVPQGMAMMIVDQGAVTEFTAEPGEFIYDSSTEPSVFYGGFGEGIKQSFEVFKDRFKFGGAAPKDQRVYYINLREIPGIKFGTAEPMAFPDPKYHITVYLRFYGKYSIRVADPVRMIANVITSMPGDVVTADVFTEEGQVREEFLTHLTSALATLAYEENASFGDIPRYQTKLAKIMNDEMDEEWTKNRGIEIVSVAVPSISLTEESKEDVRKYDEIHIASENGPGMMTAATAQAMRDAAKNESGMAGAFMGMNVGNMMAHNSANVAGAVFENQKNQAPENTQSFPAGKAQWQCPNCGVSVSGKFCSECGAKKPEMRFCSNCGAKASPESKFCSECGKQLN